MSKDDARHEIQSLLRSAALSILGSLVEYRGPVLQLEQVCIQPLLALCFDDKGDVCETEMQILVECAKRVTIMGASSILDGLFVEAHRKKSKHIELVLRSCENILSYREKFEMVESESDRRGYRTSEEKQEGEIEQKLIDLSASEAIRSLILQGLHGGAPESLRDITLEVNYRYFHFTTILTFDLLFLQCLLVMFRSCYCSWTVETDQDLSKMSGVVQGQFAGLLCSILRGEMHLMFAEIVHLVSLQKLREGVVVTDAEVESTSNVPKESKKENSKDLSPEQRKLRLQRIGILCWRCFVIRGVLALIPSSKILSFYRRPNDAVLL